MPRELTAHAINPANQRLIVLALDGPGPGGASHVYDLGRRVREGGTIYHNLVQLSFQNGPIGPSSDGVNGITHEALLAVLIDRLEGFQAGAYACEENAAALHSLRSALHWLNLRTKRREGAGIEGTMALDPAVPEDAPAVPATVTEQTALERIGIFPASPPVPCTCGEPATLGIVHRQDGPCYHAHPDAPEMTQAQRDVLGERVRQQTAEGWSREHDAEEHPNGELADAAVVYAMSHRQWVVMRQHNVWMWDLFPQDWSHKPKNRRHDLVRAAALLIAEIERLDRAAPATAGAKA